MSTINENPSIIHIRQSEKQTTDKLNTLNERRNESERETRYYKYCTELGHRVEAIYT